MAKCYMCDKKSTSVEHTPPKGFFPINMREQLITVPSCAEHNEDTSKDDEYVRNIITMNNENNLTSIDHFDNKSSKSFKRNPALASLILETMKDVPNYKTDAKAFQIDYRRFNKVIRKIAYALFFYENGYSWKRLLEVTTNQIKKSEKSNISNDGFGDKFETLIKYVNSLVLKGHNPNVFQYSFFDFSPELYDKALYMIFYEGFPFWIIPVKNSNHSDFDYNQ